MRITLRPHLKIRLRQRQIPVSFPRIILLSSEIKLADTLTGHHIAVKHLVYNHKIRPMVVAYDIIGEEYQVITVYPIDEAEIQSRIKTGRWVKDEKN